MRQLLQTLVGIAFWVIVVLLWWMLLTEHKATSAALFDTATRVGVCIGIVLGLTMWWVSHNVAIHRRKGRRRGRPDVAPNTANDRLDRSLVWDVPGDVDGARAANHLIVDIAGDAKAYRVAP